MSEVASMTTEALLEHFRRERQKLRVIHAPAGQILMGSERDEEYRVKQSAEFALAYIDVLLQRLQDLEEQVAAHSSEDGESPSA